MVNAIRDQVARIVHAQVNCYRSQLLDELAARLVEITPAGIDRFFFTNRVRRQQKAR